ncbi:MAG: L-rhamnose isomerase [Bacilli bacterium]
MEKTVIEKFKLAKKMYEEVGVDVDKALERLKSISISLQCWQGDDITGFLGEKDIFGGIQVTGNYPYKATNFNELTSDLSFALSLIPGKHRVNLHAIYANTKEDVDLDKLAPKHFEDWVKWAKKEEIMLDFNPTTFKHELSKKGFTLSSSNERVRNFFIEHCIQSRKISEYFGKELNGKSVCNLWIPDGFKDNPIDLYGPRVRLKESLDKIYSHKLNSKYILDTVESKLFGIGVEAYTTGSFEFYLNYALKNNLSVCLDSGHFHPTESISDKIASLMLFFDSIALHVSRPMRWDSDHVVLFDEETNKIMKAIIRNNFEDRIYIGLDYFDATISRTAAWVVGVRNVQKALLSALLEPTEKLINLELNENYTKRLVLTEELKTYPIGDIYNYFCLINKVPIGVSWILENEEYEKGLKR